MRALAILIVLLVGYAPARADAGDEPDTANGKAYFSDGISAFERGDHAAASRAFAAGWGVEKWSGFLFAWAQSERVAGNCSNAIELYARFIATKPKPDAREHAIGWIQKCGGEYVEPAAPPKPPDLPKPPDPPPPPRYERVERPARGFHHKLAIGLGATAIATGVVAGRFLYLAGRDFDSAKDPIEYAEVARRHERGEGRLLIGRISLGVGLGLATASAIRFVFHRAPTRFELVPMSNGAAVKGVF